jgi:transcription elongation GreA/GreB family factor
MSFWQGNAMSDTFDKLKAMLEEKGDLTDDEVAKMVAEHGEMTAEENMDLSAAIHEKRRASQATVTMDQFLEANKILDTADEDSAEYKAAQKIVDTFLAGN